MIIYNDIYISRIFHEISQAEEDERLEKERIEEKFRKIAEEERQRQIRLSPRLENHPSPPLSMSQEVFHSHFSEICDLFCASAMILILRIDMRNSHWRMIC